MIKILLLTSVVAAVQNVTYPLFKQCDMAWNENFLGYAGNRSVCLSGCLISSISMVLNECEVMLPLLGTNETVAANPGTINTWLKETGGYEDGYGFKWTSCDSLGLVWDRFASKGEDIASSFDDGHTVILHVHNNNHFVLMTGYSKTSSGLLFYVNDPFYDTQSYT